MVAERLKQLENTDDYGFVEEIIETIVENDIEDIGALEAYTYTYKEFISYCIGEVLECEVEWDLYKVHKYNKFLKGLLLYLMETEKNSEVYKPIVKTLNTILI